MVRYAVVLVALLLVGVAHGAESVEQRLARLEAIVVEMRQELALKDAEIVDLRVQAAELREAVARGASPAVATGGAVPAGSHDHSGHGHGGGGIAGGASLSAALNMTAGGSTATVGELEALQGGAHDAKRKGLTFNQLELAASGSVGDGRLQAHAILVEDDVELEEAFADYPIGERWDVRAGYFLTGFGLHNATHLHAWDWLDQPLINTRIFGSEGQRGIGLQLGTSAPVGWENRLTLSMQRAQGEFMASFDGEGLVHAHGEGGHGHDEHEEEEHGHAEFEEGIGGRPLVGRETDGLDDFVWSVRWTNAFDVGEETRLGLGASAALGPNHAGGQSVLWGLDVTLAHGKKWQWRTEVIGRSFEADAIFLEGDEPLETDDDLSFGADTLSDWGITSEFVYALDDAWSLGVRGEYASGDGQSYEEGQAIDRNDDPYRGDRLRLSPIVGWRLNEAVRLRLQYNFDKADFLSDGEAHGLWFGAEWLLGGHAGHNH